MESVEITKPLWHSHFCRTVIIYSLNLNDWYFSKYSSEAHSVSLVANGLAGVIRLENYRQPEALTMILPPSWEAPRLGNQASSWERANELAN